MKSLHVRAREELAFIINRAPLIMISLKLYTVSGSCIVTRFMCVCARDVRVSVFILIFNTCLNICTEAYVSYVGWIYFIGALPFWFSLLNTLQLSIIFK